MALYRTLTLLPCVTLSGVLFYISVSQIIDVSVTEDDVNTAIHLLKPKKCDSDSVYTEDTLALLYVSHRLACLLILLHPYDMGSYMPKCLCDCVLIPIPKSKFL